MYGTVDPLTPVVMVAVAVGDKVGATLDLVDAGLVLALVLDPVLALTISTPTGVLMLRVMAVAMATVQMVEVALGEVVDLDTVMCILKHTYPADNPKLKPKIYEVFTLVFFLSFVLFHTLASKNKGLASLFWQMLYRGLHAPNG
jgi:hypothetical protein